MARRKKNKVVNQVSNEMPMEIKNEAANLVQNGLSEAIMGFDPGGIGTQVSQVDTLFKNNRWYLVSNMRQLLSEIYVEHGLVQTIVDIPVDDGMRGGVDIHSEQLDEDEITQLQTEIEQEDDLGQLGMALKWGRLFGGGGLIINTNEDFSTPLNIEKLKEGSKIKFIDADMWELFWAKQTDSDYSQAMDGLDVDTEYYDYYGKKVHRSRVLIVKGKRAPSFIRPRLRGWGLSVIENLVRSINQYLKANNLTFEVLDEFKIDIFKINNLASTLMSPNGESKVRQRITLANAQKNYQNAITMDAEDDYVQKQLSFAGISETMDGIRKQIASDMRMPLTKLFGISSAGFSSGEDDIENYNAMIESGVRQQSKQHIIKIIEIRCQQLFGFIPDDITVDFRPLRVMSSEQEENVKTQKFSRLLQARQAGEISPQEFKEACNKENLFPIKVDATADTLPTAQSEKGEAAPTAPASTTSAPSAPEPKI